MIVELPWPQNTELFCKSKGRIQLGEKRIGEGRQASIWPLANSEIEVAKIWDRYRTGEESSRLLSLMSRLQESGFDWHRINVTVPSDTVHLINGEMVGYLMPALTTSWIGLSRLLQSPRLSLRTRVALAKQLANTVQIAHARDLIIGDLQPQNLMVRNNPWRIGVIDVDSWSYVPRDDAGEGDVTGEVRLPIFPRPELCHDDYMPPGELVASRVTDRFALATIVVQLLEGQHPYQFWKREGGPRPPSAGMEINECWIFAPEEFVLPSMMQEKVYKGLYSYGEDLRDLTSLVFQKKDFRPAHEWAQVLEGTQVIDCPSCQVSHFVGASACENVVFVPVSTKAKNVSAHIRGPSKHKQDFDVPIVEKDTAGQLADPPSTESLADLLRPFVVPVMLGGACLMALFVVIAFLVL